MTKFWKYLRIGIICVWRVVFDYFAWILPCSRHPEKTPLEVRYAKARSLIIFVLRHMNFDLRTENLGLLHAKEPTLFVGNHTSSMDPLLAIALSPKPLSFVSKMESKKIIVVGRLITAIEGVFLDRDDPFQAMRCFRTVAKNMKTYGLSYCIFPEGTRNRDPLSGKLFPFHPGSFKIAHMAKCPMATFALFGSHRLFGKGPVKGHLVQFRMLSRYESDFLLSKKTTELCDLAQNEIEGAVGELLAVDKEHEETKKKDKPAEWWKNLPQEE